MITTKTKLFPDSRKRAITHSVWVVALSIFSLLTSSVLAQEKLEVQGKLLVGVSDFPPTPPTGLNKRFAGPLMNNPKPFAFHPMLGKR